MIDTHCHIDFEEYDEDRSDVIKRAQEKLDAVIVSGISEKSNQGILDLSDKYKNFIYPSFGYHPVSSQNCSDEELKGAHEHLINHIDEIVAVGEVGMDFFYVKDKSLRARQKEIFTSLGAAGSQPQTHPVLITGRTTAVPTDGANAYWNDWGCLCTSPPRTAVLPVWKVQQTVRSLMRSLQKCWKDLCSCLPMQLSV